MKKLLIIICFWELIIILVLLGKNIELNAVVMHTSFPYYSISDEDFLGIKSISELNETNEKDKQNVFLIEEYAPQLLLQLYDHSSDKLKNVPFEVSDAIYNKIINGIYGTTEKSNIGMENFVLDSILVRCKNNKAIINYTYGHSFEYNGIKSGIGSYKCPTKIYLEYINGSWTIVNWEQAI